MFARKSLLSIFTVLFLTCVASAGEVRGIVIKANPQKGELTVEGRGRGARGVTFTFRLDKDTQVLLGNEPGKTSDLATGARVRVVYELQGDQRVAVMVNVRTPLLPAAAVPAATDTNTLSGTLRRIAYTDREIVLVGPDSKGAESETTLTAPEEVKVTRDQKPIRFDDLKEGERAVVHTEKKDGKLLARSIEVGVVATKTPTDARKERIQQIRGFLKMLDWYLQMQEHK
jgi:hypothetical protein